MVDSMVIRKIAYLFLIPDSSSTGQMVLILTHIHKHLGASVCLLVKPLLEVTGIFTECLVILMILLRDCCSCIMNNRSGWTF